RNLRAHELYLDLCDSHIETAGNCWNASNASVRRDGYCRIAIRRVAFRSLRPPSLDDLAARSLYIIRDTRLYANYAKQSRNSVSGDSCAPVFHSRREWSFTHCLGRMLSKISEEFRNRRNLYAGRGNLRRHRTACSHMASGRYG